MILRTNMPSTIATESGEKTLAQWPAPTPAGATLFDLASEKNLVCPLYQCRVLLSPQELWEKFPLTEPAAQTVMKGRWGIERILDGVDRRKFLVVGPCSIHDPVAAIEYAWKLKQLADSVADKLLVVMRVYLEKPRTVLGWKGLINDPDLDGSCQIEKGLEMARALCLQILEMGLPVATEVLSCVAVPYISDLLCWAAIGARTVESQIHREMASGLRVPVGLKNRTDGNIQVALQAIQAVRAPQGFLGIDGQGRACFVRSGGNPYSHLVLRGGGGQVHSDPSVIGGVRSQLEELQLPANIVVDCSHGNSNKDHRKQKEVFCRLVELMAAGERALVGLMLESNLFEGSQPIPSRREELKYGVSVTDKCLGWEETEELILGAYKLLPQM